MWKHKNFINLQLHAPEYYDITINGTAITVNVTLGYMWKNMAVDNPTLYTCTDTNVVWNDGTILQYNGVDVLPTDDIIYNGQYTTRSAAPTPTFKHFFDAGTIGSGTVKFRHYSQQEPSSGETWVLNESGLENHTLSEQFIAFTSNDKSYIAIANFSSGSGLFYYTTEYDYDAPYLDGGPRGFIWTDQAYRTLTFTTPPTGDLLTWLQANGTKQGGGASN